MPKKKPKTDNKLYLAGDWSITGVTEQFPLLVQHISRAKSADSGDTGQKVEAVELPEIDLSGLTDLDASGCQLLVFFLKTLNQYGIFPTISNIPDIHISKIRSLGFGRELLVNGSREQA